MERKSNGSGGGAKTGGEQTRNKLLTSSHKKQDVRDARGSAECPVSTGDFSPEKNSHDLHNGDVPSVASFASEIRVNWQRGVDTFMNIARLCADANTRLTDAKKRELMACLPFGEATFSKFAKIGADTRLKSPEIQRLLPPRYTTMYAITFLTDEQLERAIAVKVIHPDLEREELQKWRKSQRGLPGKSGAEDGAGDPPVASPTDATTQDGIESGHSPPSSSQREIHENLGAPYDLCPALPATETASDPDVLPAAAEQLVESPTTVPVNDDEILDRLSPDDQRAWDALSATWDAFVEAWKGASKVVRARFNAKVLQSKTSSRSAAE